jgi:hypothetical protein
MKPVSVAAFNSREEAEPLCACLVAAGIAAEIRDELRLDAGLGFGRPSAGVRVEVPRADFEAALQFVYGWNAGADAHQEPIEWLTPGTSGRPAQVEVRPRPAPGEVR